MNMEIATNFEAIKFIGTHSQSIAITAIVHANCTRYCTQSIVNQPITAHVHAKFLTTTVIKTLMNVIDHKPQPHNSVRLKTTDLIHVDITSTLVSDSMNLVDYGCLGLFG